MALIALFAVGVSASASVAWKATLTAFFAVAVCSYFGIVTYKLFLIFDAWRRHVRPLRPTLLPDAALPTFTVLVPLYKEGGGVAPLVTHLSRLDYPAGKIEVLLLVEENDPETLSAINDVRMPPWVRAVVVPDGEPRTKPRACNHGLGLARGEMVVIYDAEDRPELDQLRVAAGAFAESDEDVVCLQARLDYHNHAHNWLTRFFAVEYNHWFDLLLPSLSVRSMPIPLGGTSNHFRADALRSLGGWDPWNVTEDADLGIRLYSAGKCTAVIDSITWEEACAQPGAWIKQRTRWLKGYMQTALVHTRNLDWLRRPGGRVRAAVGFAVMVPGTPAVNLFNPIFWALFVIHSLTRWGLIVELIPAWVLYVGMLNLLVGNMAFIAVNLLGVDHRRRWHLVWAAVLSPAYWLMMSVATWRALFQLLFDPHTWEKTPHGLSGADTDPALRAALGDEACDG